MPWATPPCTWPSTMFGLIIRPQSSRHHVPQDLDLAGVGIDLDGGARGVAFDHIVVGRHGAVHHLEHAVESRAAASPTAGTRRCATCCTGTDFVGVPFTDTTPSATSRSSGAASSRCAAMAKTFSRSRIVASVTACADHRAAAAPAGAGAERRRFGVALMHGDVVEVDAEVLGDELRGGGLEALAVRAGADVHVDAAVGVHAHVRGLVGVRGRRPVCGST